MKVDDDKVFIGIFNRQIACQQAALQVSRAHGPAEGAGQSNALGAVHSVIRGGQQTAVDFADRRQGIGHKGAGIVEGIGVVKTLRQYVLFVDVIASGGVFVHLLQHTDVGARVLDGLGYAGQVFVHSVLVGTFDIFAAVHEEIGAGAKSGVADIPGQHGDVLVGADGGRAAYEGCLSVLHVGGLILRDGKPGQQGACQNYYGQKYKANDLENFFSHKKTPRSD